MTSSGQPQLWESLVTEQHVRAARLRSIQAPLVMLGVLLIFLVTQFGQLTPTDDAPVTPAQRLAQSRLQMESAVSRASQELSVPSMTFEQIQALPQAGELQQVVRATLDQLSQNDRLPDDLKLQELSRDDFWRGAWPPATLAYIEGRNSYAIGAHVAVHDQRDRSAGGDEPIRQWLGVFRKYDGEWLYAAVRTGEPPENGGDGIPRAQAQSISGTVFNLLPEGLQQ